jgi:uncharacterized RDD family membrane protein YckC
VHRDKVGGPPKAARLDVRTPEGIVFSLPLAGPVTRGAAWIIDLVVISISTSVLTELLAPVAFIASGLGDALSIFLFFVIQVGYGMVLEWLWRGQTLGKRLLGLRVMDERGLRLRPSQVAMRNLMRIADLLPFAYVVGGVAAFISPRCQRLGDLAAGTVVTRRVRHREPDLDALLAGKFNSFRQHPHLEARLRQVVSPEEAQVALSALLRRDELEAGARLELYREIADRFRAAVTFPEDCVLGLNDEQYIRNVVETMFRKRRR